MNDLESNLTRRRGQPAGSPIPLLTVLLEVLWAYPWLMWASSWKLLAMDKPPLGFGAALALIVTAEEASRYFLAKQWPIVMVRLVTVLVLGLALLIVVRIELGGSIAIWEGSWWGAAGNQPSGLALGLVFGIFLLLRGIGVGRATLTFDDLHQKFFFGLGALVLLFIIWGLSSGEGQFQRIVASTSLFVVAFFFISLMGLAAVNLQSGQQGMLPQEVVSSLMSRNWLTLYLAIILGIIGVSGLLAFTFSLNILSWVGRPVGALADALLTLFFYGIIVPLAYIAGAIFFVVRFLLSLISSGDPPELNIIDFTALREVSEGRSLVVPPLAILVLKWGLLALVVGVVVFFLARALFRSDRAKEEQEDTVSESLWSWESLKQELRYLMVAAIGWLYKRRRVRPVPVVPPIATLEGESDERQFSIREIYQGLLWEGQGAGLARKPSVTPYEYQRQLKERLADSTEQLREITDAYVAERYGETPPPDAELGILNRLWRQVRTAFHGTGESAPGASDASHGQDKPQQ